MTTLIPGGLLLFVFLAVGGGCSDSAKLSSDAAPSRGDAGSLSDAKPEADDLSLLPPPDDARPVDTASATPDLPKMVDTRTEESDVAPGQRSDAGREAPGSDVSPEAPGAVCTGPENSAPIVEPTVVADPPPTPKGGEIAQGLYQMTRLIRYNGQAPAAAMAKRYRFTVEIDSMLTMKTSSDNFETGVTEHYNFSIYPMNGAYPSTTTTVSWLFICPISSGGLPYGYDVAGNTLVFYDTDSWGPRGLVLTKQQ